MQSEGCADAQATGTGVQHLVLLHIGGQFLVTGVNGVELSATDTVLTDAQLVTAVNGYVTKYASCRTGTDPVTIAIGTNNDGLLRDSAAGADWADHVVDPVAAQAAADQSIVIAGANDIEWTFKGTEADAENWTR